MLLILSLFLVGTLGVLPKISEQTYTPFDGVLPILNTTIPTLENWCIGGYGIQVCGSDRVAGAIDYLTWNGVQFINAFDHGRELQIAISNQHGECYNPTEAGSMNDAAGSRTTSRLQGLSTSGNVYRTTTLPAFWLAPGQRDPGNGCIAVNTSPLSNYQTSKAISLGYLGVPNALQYLISVVVPENGQNYLQIEAPTGYMPGNNIFNTFWSINLHNGQLANVNPGGGTEILEPVIISTPDRNFAMGAYLVGAPSQYVHYALFNFPSPNGADATSKWSVVWRGWMNFASGQILGFETVICVGNLTTVQQCMVTMASKTGWIIGT